MNEVERIKREDFCAFKARLGFKAWQCLKDEHQKCF